MYGPPTRHTVQPPRLPRWRPPQSSTVPWAWLDFAWISRTRVSFGSGFPPRASSYIYCEVTCERGTPRGRFGDDGRPREHFSQRESRTEKNGPAIASSVERKKGKNGDRQNVFRKLRGL
ncbi:hypothetical protein MRX96_014915 [Rhipicephalus microplus]